MAVTKHGLRRTSEYTAWDHMKRRCNNPKDYQYKNYGGRGITVCKRWINSFENFIADMGMKPTPNHSLDRKKVNKNYTPSNCRWATVLEQQNNRRDSVIKTIGKESKTVSEWCREFGLSTYKVFGRINRGVPDNLIFYKGRLPYVPRETFN